jgi:ketosteroid isomerase-like protein
MKIFSLLFLLLSLTMIASAQNSKAQTDIRKVMDEQAVAWNRGDVEGFMQGYWKSEQMVFVSGNNVARGWQAALDRYKKNYDSKAKMGTLSFNDLEITVLSKDSAVVLGSWALKRAGDNPGGKFTLIFRKFKDGWKIIHDHTS